MQLDHRARVQPGIHLACQSDPSKRRRAAQAAHAPQELRPVGCYAVWFFTACQERHALAESGVVGIGSQQGMLVGDELRINVGLVYGARGTQHPFGVIGDCDSPRTLPQVLQAQLCYLDRCIRCREQAQVLVQAMALAFEDRIAGSVAYHVQSFSSGRHGCGAPDQASLFIAQVERLTRHVGYRVIAPGRQAVLAAVLCPRGTRTRF